MTRQWLMMLGGTIMIIALTGGQGPAAEEGGHAETVPSVSRIEVVLAKEYQDREKEIKAEFAQAGLTNVHIQFARLGHPPKNIGLGRDVPADKAREAIRLAIKYNDGIDILLPERLFPPRFITIASSNFDDTVEYPITASELAKLQDPTLTTESFHRLYRELTSAPLEIKGRHLRPY
ncbi:MAG: hypothetical protein NNA23_06810 [Nitrospira sp.]|nr:hypothetical protein [Nitrospira sp.]